MSKCKNPKCTTKTVNWLSTEELEEINGLCSKCFEKIIREKISAWKAVEKENDTGCPF